MIAAFTVAGKADKNRFSCELRGAVICGYTGREQSGIHKHIAELEKQGIPGPPSVPMFYPKPGWGLCADGEIQVQGAQTSGEIEFILLFREDKIYVGAGSDHTDREVEKYDILKSKQMCPAVFAPNLWSYEEIKDHWDRIEIRSWAIVGAERVLYQESTLAAILPPDDLIARVRARVRGGLEGVVIYSGTPPLLTNGFVFAQRFEGELADPVKGRKILLGYDIHRLEWFIDQPGR